MAGAILASSPWGAQRGIGTRKALSGFAPLMSSVRAMSLARQCRCGAEGMILKTAVTCPGDGAGKPVPSGPDSGVWDGRGCARSRRWW